jgi:hypothetical protein
LQLDPDDKGSDAARISELLATSRTFGCKLIPVLDAQCDSYRMNALAAHIHNAISGGAIRISLNDLQNDKLGELLATLLASVRLKASDCVLVVDLSDATISDHAIFAKFISEWLSKLRHFGSWRRIIVEASSYPTKNPAAPNSESRTSRDEWLCWLNLAKSDPGILEWASFGDFGADHGQIAFGGGGRTVTHLRYATAKHWIVGRGGDPTSDHDGTIHTVAKRIVSTGEFMGEGFSAGDEFILACAEKSSPGNGSTWRWANMVHHMTLATAGVGDLIGSPIERPKRAVRAKQLSLLTAGD